MDVDNDLEFIQMSCFLYEFRMNERLRDKTMDELSRWLQSKGKLNILIGYDTPAFISSLSPNFSKILDIVNLYSPNFPMIISIQSEKEKYMLKKLDFQSNSPVTYRSKGIISIPCFHGGEIIVDGKIDGLDLQEIIKVSNPFVVFKTSIVSSAIDIDQERVDTILSELYSMIENSDDEDLYKFTLKSAYTNTNSNNISTLKASTLFIRNWKITFFVDDAYLHLRAEKDLFV